MVARQIIRSVSKQQRSTQSGLSPCPHLWVDRHLVDAILGHLDVCIGKQVALSAEP